MASSPDISVVDSLITADASTGTSESELRERLRCPPIDLQQLLENCLGMPTFAVSLLEEFDRTAASRVASFEEQFKAANLPAVAELGHALKGVAGILAALGLRDIAVEIEVACQQGDLPRTAHLIDLMRTDVHRIQHDIPEIRKRLLPATD